MKAYSKLPLYFLSLTLACAATSPVRADDAAANIKTDAQSGLKIAPGWQAVKANCTACHSAKLITAQQGDRETWLKIIRWMQNTQGLWALDHTTENTLLNYLATQYPPVWNGRRANLPAGAMPPNPWLP
ncbi:MAG: hypothetical protein CVV13_05420 [Gammaproteobacteria bacterium HGW-Gammaproteobacteria-3]|nr:MAG: hypothetical protein CVV13_05420 [Gammaproteobacteria bacterium HGW-Gammaproteobacteria-3]